MRFGRRLFKGLLCWEKRSEPIPHAAAAAGFVTQAGLLNGLHLTLIMANITKPQDVGKIKHAELAYGTAEMCM